MNEEKMKSVIDTYCTETDCDECKLQGQTWSHATVPFNCINTEEASMSDIKKAYDIITGESASENATTVDDFDEMEQKYERHAKICGELNRMYRIKNTAYGDSFSKSFAEWGMACPGMRIEDKINRFKALAQNHNISAGDESIIDTLRDLANYAIMTIIELEGKHD